MKRHRWFVGIAAALLATAVCGAAWFVHEWQTRGPSEPSMSDALERFRLSPSNGGTVSPAVPTAGVYTFKGEGQEKLSFMATHQKQGPMMPGTVTSRANGCWSFDIEYNSFHEQTWNWCLRDGRVVELGGTTEQAFDFAAFKIDETNRVVCDPPFVIVDPEDVPGESTTAACRGHSTTTGSDMRDRGTVRFVGREILDIADTSVATLHYRTERAISGDQTGRQTSDFWFAAENLMLVRNEREIRVESPAPAPLNAVTYSERGSFELMRLEPQS
jgi:hypothetical protein